MKIVKIRMKREFNFSSRYDNLDLREGEEYYAIDGGVYWLIQSKQGYPFSIVVPKVTSPPPEEPMKVAEIVE